MTCDDGECMCACDHQPANQPHVRKTHARHAYTPISLLSPAEGVGAGGADGEQHRVALVADPALPAGAPVVVLVFQFMGYVWNRLG